MESNPIEVVAGQSYLFSIVAHKRKSTPYWMESNPIDVVAGQSYLFSIVDLAVTML